MIPSFLFGIFLVFVLYFFTWIAVRGMVKGGVTPTFLVVVKYLIFWKLISEGFKHFLVIPGMIGFTLGIYLSLPALYLANRRCNRLRERKDLDL